MGGLGGVVQKGIVCVYAVRVKTGFRTWVCTAADAALHRRLPQFMCERVRGGDGGGWVVVAVVCVVCFCVRALACARACLSVSVAGLEAVERG